jgi:hypothetical protein
VGARKKGAWKEGGKYKVKLVRVKGSLDLGELGWE